nr:hypothetical protein [Tanacetum cinerariifolium]
MQILGRGRDSQRHVVVWQKLPSYIEGEQMSNDEITKETKTKHVEKKPEVEDVEMEPEHQSQPDKGKGIARNTDESPIKLVKASYEVRPDLDALVRVPFEINVISQTKKFWLIMNWKREIKKLKTYELRKKRIDQYRWTTSSRLKLETIIVIHIHSNTKLVIITVFIGNDRRNFDVFSLFKFGDFGVTELDKLSPIIQKKKNIVVSELMTSMGKRYERLKKILEEFGITTALLAPGHVLSLTLGRKRKIQELKPETRIPGWNAIEVFMRESYLSTT